MDKLQASVGEDGTIQRKNQVVSQWRYLKMILGKDVNDEFGTLSMEDPMASISTTQLCLKELT